MKRKWSIVVVAFLAAIGGLYTASRIRAQASPQNDGEYDLIIRNGHILDGAGGPWYSSDIAIREDRIAAIGKLDNARAKKVIDATGKVVSPGFIDMLGQSETALLI